MPGDQSPTRAKVGSISSEVEEAVKFFFDVVVPTNSWKKYVELNLPQGTKIPSAVTIKRLEASYRSEISLNSSVDSKRGQYSNIRKFVEAVYKNKEFVLSDQHVIISDILGKYLAIDSSENSANFNRYIGKYVVLREKSRTKKEEENTDSAETKNNDIELIEEELNLTYRGPVPWFYHKAGQYPHSGPVFVVNDRMYLMGIGQDTLRQWTVMATRNPKNSAVPGISMIHRDRKPAIIPAAALTVMFHESNTMNPESRKRETRRLLSHKEGRTSVLEAWSLAEAASRRTPESQT